MELGLVTAYAEDIGVVVAVASSVGFKVARCRVDEAWKQREALGHRYLYCFCDAPSARRRPPL